MSLTPLPCKAFIVFPGGEITFECELNAHGKRTLHRAQVTDVHAVDSRSRRVDATITWGDR